MRITAFCLDTFGDLILREPMFRSLLQMGHEISVVVRSAYRSVLPLIDPRISIIESDVKPYSASPAASQTAALLELDDRVRRSAPDALLFPMFNRTGVEPLLARRFMDLPRIGLAGGPPPLHSMEEAARLLGWERCDDSAFLTIPVYVEEDIHECDKYSVLLKKGFGYHSDLSNPKISVTDEVKDAASSILQALKVTGPFALFSTVGATNVSIKSMPTSIARESAALFYEQAGMSTLLTGLESERDAISALQEALEGDAIPVHAWIGNAEQFDLLAGLAWHSSLYCGSDTGPMHLAAAMGKPVLAVFGGGTFPRFLPRADAGFVATQKLPCFGCNWSCSLDHVACIDLVDPEIVREGFARVINGTTSGVELHTGRLQANAARAIWRDASRRRLDPHSSPLREKDKSIARQSEQGSAESTATGAERAAYRENIEQLQDELSRTNVILTEVQRDNGARLDFIHQLKDQIAQLEKQVALKQSETDNLNNTLQEVERDRAARLDFIYELQGRLDEVKSLQASAQGEANTLREALRTAEETVLNELRALRTQQQTEVLLAAALERNSGLVQQALEDRLIVEGLKVQVAQSEAALAKAFDSIVRLQDSAEASRVSGEQVLEALRNSQLECENIRKTVAQETSELRAKELALTNQNKELRSELEAQSSALVETQQRLDFIAKSRWQKVGAIFRLTPDSGNNK
jgi:ADP-heptose:LPS heptosyltransferase